VASKVSTAGPLLLIAGSGRYPSLLLEEARKAGVARVAVAAFESETGSEVIEQADEVRMLRVGQLGALLDFARKVGAREALMAGQITPGRLFDLRPDFKALVLLARLKQRNAETLFGAVADQLEKVGTQLLPATTYLESHMAPGGLISGPSIKPRQLEDLEFGFRIARETSRMDIGQSVVVKNGTVLAVEAFEGTDRCIQRGGELGRGKALLVKVTKPNQDMRFDVPVVGEKTVRTASEAGVSVIGVEAGRTLLLDKKAVSDIAASLKVSLYGLGGGG